jgi:hypothetical protein
MLEKNGGLVSWTRYRNLTCAALVLGATATMAACVAYSDTYEVDVQVTVVDDSPVEGERYHALLMDMNAGGCNNNHYWYGSCELLDWASGGTPGTARVQALTQTEGDDCDPVLQVAVFRDRDGDGWWDTGGQEPCAMVSVDPPYQHDEPIVLDVWTRNCDEYYPTPESCDLSVLIEEVQP